MFYLKLTTRVKALKNLAAVAKNLDTNIGDRNETRTHIHPTEQYTIDFFTFGTRLV